MVRFASCERVLSPALEEAGLGLCLNVNSPTLNFPDKDANWLLLSLSFVSPPKQSVPLICCPMAPKAQMLQIGSSHLVEFVVLGESFGSKESVHGKKGPVGSPLDWKEGVMSSEAGAGGRTWAFQKPSRCGKQKNVSAQPLSLDGWSQSELACASPWGPLATTEGALYPKSPSWWCDPSLPPSGGLTRAEAVLL